MPSPNKDAEFVCLFHYDFYNETARNLCSSEGKPTDHEKLIYCNNSIPTQNSCPRFLKALGYPFILEIKALDELALMPAPSDEDLLATARGFV